MPIKFLPTHLSPSDWDINNRRANEGDDHVETANPPVLNLESLSNENPNTTPPFSKESEILKSIRSQKISTDK
eukprot:snap_masked-scaffold_2-processed-gene-21.12-mRNA-1 protein AED:1.00 eAED:1.00 QI:0/0/0/0/1/1/2/0/72